MPDYGVLLAAKGRGCDSRDEGLSGWLQVIAGRQGPALGAFSSFLVVNAVRENPDEEPDQTGADGETEEDTEAPEEPAERDPQEDAAGSGDTGCFVATAVYRDAMHPDVRSLRRFRDRYLAPHAAGRVVMRLYRRFGPCIATYVLHHPRIARSTRRLLAALVRILRRRLRHIDR